MAERVASIFAEIGMDAGKFESGASGVLGQLSKLTEAFAGSAEEAAVFGAALGVLGAGISAQIDFEKEMHNSLVQNAKLEAVLKATGGAIGMTAGELENYAYQLAKVNGLDDETVVSAEALALTFSNMNKKTFPEFMQTAADMSALLETDLKGSVQKLGYALADFDGFTRLGRTVDNLSDAQVATLKHFKTINDLAGYQAYLLDLLQGKYGGTAKAMNDASDGSANLALEWGNLKENLGTLSPIVADFNNNLAGIFKTINDNFGVIRGLYDGLQRIRIALLTLGISEVIRAFQTLFGVINAGMSGGGSAIWNYLFPPSGGAQHAAGGSFVIPSQYGHEGFRLGNYGTASAGERVTITPATSSGNMGASVVINGLTIGDTSGLSRGDIVDMMKQVVNEAMA